MSKKKHGTAPEQVTGVYAEFLAAAIRAMPRDIPPDIAHGWINNGRSLRCALRGVLLPPEMENGFISPDFHLRIAEKTFDGKKVRIDFARELAYWQGIYADAGLTKERGGWVELPETLNISPEQEAEMRRLIREYGFNKVIIKPKNLVDKPIIENKAIKTPAGHYALLHAKTSAGYGSTFQGNNYKKDGGFGGSEDKSNELTIILTKDVQNLADDELFNETKGKSPDNLDAQGGIFEKYGVRGMSESAYLMYQLEYFKRTGKHLDEQGATWFTETGRPVSGRVSYGGWHVSHLEFDSHGADSHGGFIGCRLAGSFVLKQ